MASKTITILESSCIDQKDDHSHAYAVEGRMHQPIIEALPSNAKITSVVLRVKTYHTWTSILGGNATIKLSAWFCPNNNTAYNSGTNLIPSTKITNNKTWATYKSANLVEHFTTTYPFTINTSYSMFSIYYKTANVISRDYYHNIYLDIEYDELPTYTITTAASPSEGGTVTGGGTYTQGASATLTATPSTGWYLYYWLKNNETVDYGTDVNPYTATVDGNATYTAVFAKHHYIITFYSNGGTGTMAPQTPEYQENVTLIANNFTRAGYSFAGWATSPTGEKVYDNQATFKYTFADHIDLYAVWKPHKIYIGTSQPSKIYFGKQVVKEVYFGTTKVYG